VYDIWVLNVQTNQRDYDLMTELETAASACRARIANAERALAYATEKYEAEITAQALGNAAGSASALDKRVADLATKKEEALKWLERERDILAGIMRALEQEKRRAAEADAEAQRIRILEILGRLDKAASRATLAIAKAGEAMDELLEIAAELGAIGDGEGGAASRNNATLPLLQGAAIDLIRAGTGALGSRFPNSADVRLRRNERVDCGLVRAARVVRYRATGEPVDGEPVDGDDGDQAEAA
jgi:hypothetical protein